MKTPIKTLNEFKDNIYNTFNTNYHNGYIEGNNNFIKVLKRIAFGFRSFRRFKARIMICNDIADFTHNFAGLITDLLTDMAANLEDNQRYNIIMEWGMRTPEGPLQCMKNLKQKGYTNIVDFVAVQKDISLEACKIRADVMNSNKHIIRRVPESFHSLSVSTLPASADKIYVQGVLQDKSVDKMIISTRDGKKIWEERDLTKPSIIYEQVLQDIRLSQNMTNNPELALTAYINEAYGFSAQYQDILNSQPKM